MKSYAVLLAPEFRLQAKLRHLPGVVGQPAALLEMQGAKPRVVAKVLSELTGVAANRLYAAHTER